MPDRVRVTAPAIASPVPRRVEPVRLRHRMLTTRQQQPPAVDVVPVPDADEVDRLSEVVAPDSHARPGTPGIEVAGDP